LIRGCDEQVCRRDEKPVHGDVWTGFFAVRRLGRTADARAAYERALSLTLLEPERRFLERWLREL
jgi:predicted RNA polymerase sigma factor